MKELNFGRPLEFLKTLKSAEPALGGILKSNVSPFRKCQNIYYTPPGPVVLGICKTTFNKNLSAAMATRVLREI